MLQHVGAVAKLIRVGAGEMLLGYEGPFVAVERPHGEPDHFVAVGRVVRERLFLQVGRAFRTELDRLVHLAGRGRPRVNGSVFTVEGRTATASVLEAEHSAHDQCTDDRDATSVGPRWRDQRARFHSRLFFLKLVQSDGRGSPLQAAFQASSGRGAARSYVERHVVCIRLIRKAFWCISRVAWLLSGGFQGYSISLGPTRRVDECATFGAPLLAYWTPVR